MITDEFLFFTQEGKFDEKNRLTLPSKSNCEEGEELYVQKKENKRYQLRSYKLLKKRLELMNEQLDSDMTYDRYCDCEKLYNLLTDQIMCIVTVDKQRRITIPTKEFKKSGLTKSVILKGIGNHIEICSENEDKSLEMKI